MVLVSGLMLTAGSLLGGSDLATVQLDCVAAIANFPGEGGCNGADVGFCCSVCCNLNGTGSKSCSSACSSEGVVTVAAGGVWSETALVWVTTASGSGGSLQVAELDGSKEQP